MHQGTLRRTWAAAAALALASACGAAVVSTRQAPTSASVKHPAALRHDAAAAVNRHVRVVHDAAAAPPVQHDASPGAEPCSGSLCSGLCVHTDADPDNCGACGKTCASLCVAGRCKRVVGVSAGDVHTCALLADGTAACWGDNSEGQLGNGTTTDHTFPEPVPGVAHGVAIASGNYITCVLRRDRGVTCWGPTDGKIGKPSTAAPMADLSGVRQIVPSLDRSCAVLVNGALECWKHGKKPLRISGLARVAAVGLSAFHQCALLDSGTVDCWGSGGGGALGHGTTASRDWPVPVQLPARARKIFAGAGGSCALLSNASLVCWGGGFGLWPARVPGIRGVKDVSLHHPFCVLQTNGTLLCPSNHPGKNGAHLGAVPGLTHVVGMTTGGGQVCAIRSNGSLWCWGRNNDGQVGDGTTRNRASPVRVGRK